MFINKIFDFLVSREAILKNSKHELISPLISMPNMLDFLWFFSAEQKQLEMKNAKPKL